VSWAFSAVGEKGMKIVGYSFFSIMITWIVVQGKRRGKVCKVHEGCSEEGG
jgi:hypothetical protein